MFSFSINFPISRNAILAVSETVFNELNKISADTWKDEEGCDNYKIGLIAKNIRYSKFIAFDRVRICVNERQGAINTDFYYSRLMLLGAIFSVLLILFQLIQPPIRMPDLILGALLPWAIVILTLLAGRYGVRSWLKEIAF